MSERKVRVALLFGGRSGEHAISAATAAGVLKAIDREKYDVIPVGITRDGRWVVASDDPAVWELRSDRLPEVTAASGSEVVLSSSSDGPQLQVLEAGSVPAVLGQVDVVFPVLHGPFGEDGTVQGLLELADVRYVGSGVLASAVGMDKHYMKLVFAAHGLPVGPYVVVTAARLVAGGARTCSPGSRSCGCRSSSSRPAPARRSGSPGSTISPTSSARSRTHRCTTPRCSWRRASRDVRSSAPCWAGEATRRRGRRSPARSWSTTPPGTSTTSRPSTSTRGRSGSRRPADLPPAVSERVRDLAVRAFEAIGAEGIARVDVFVTPEDQVVLNEINTMPGFTPISMYPRMWEASGLAYPDLIDELIQLALERRTGLR